MDMEKVAQGFELVVANIMLLSEKLDTDFYDAFVEQNAAFLDDTDQEIVELSVNNDKLRQLNLGVAKTFSICFVERVTSRTTSAQSCNDSRCNWFNF